MEGEQNAPKAWKGEKREDLTNSDASKTSNKKPILPNKSQSDGQIIIGRRPPGILFLFGEYTGNSFLRNDDIPMLYVHGNNNYKININSARNS